MAQLNFHGWEWAPFEEYLWPDGRLRGVYYKCKREMGGDLGVLLETDGLTKQGEVAVLLWIMQGAHKRFVLKSGSEYESLLVSFIEAVAGPPPPDLHLTGRSLWLVATGKEWDAAVAAPPAVTATPPSATAATAPAKSEVAAAG